LATFDYFKAIWKNGSGVVSDAPPWALDEIERELPVWLAAHEREFIGVHRCTQSNLILGILVSPSAFGDDGSLEDARYGSFIHVFATDHPGRVTLRVEEVRALFESTYGTPISDAAVRQQRNFMLLDFPFHMDLAKDLFIDKDRVEGGMDLAAWEPSSEFEETHEGLVSPHTPPEEPESQPLPSGSLSSLLIARGPVLPSRGPDGLPFDQGRSYEEVIAGLRERLYGKASPTERERTVEGPTAPVVPVPAPDAPPLVSVMRAEIVVAAAEADAEVADEKETEFEPGSFDPLPALERIERVESPAPRRAWSPIYTAALVLVAGLLVGGVLVFRSWERATIATIETMEPSLAERGAAVAVLPDHSARLLAREGVESDGGTEVEVLGDPAGLAIDASELKPKSLQPAVEVASLEVITEEAKADLPAVEPAVPTVIAEAELPALAVMHMKSAPESGVQGAASGLDPALSSVALEPAAVIAQIEVVTEPQPATDGITSNSARRETKQRDGRRERQRKRVMGQISRYR
jgi:hypothetical protein